MNRKKRRRLSPLVFSILSFFLVPITISTQPLATISIDYASSQGTLNKSVLMGVARGGHAICDNLYWLSGYSDSCKDIGIRMVRFDWILSDSFYGVVSRNASEELVYDFSKLDAVLLPYLRNNIKPLMCMTTIPAALGGTDTQTVYPADNMLDYKAVIAEIVKHYKDLGYEGLAWESDNEPEGFTAWTPRQVYDKYKYFAEAVKEADPTALAGGYGSVGHDWIGYMRQFLDIYKADDHKPAMDFFSLHQYQAEDFFSITEAVQEFKNRGLEIPQSGIWLTEWNGAPYDTNANASYIAKKLFRSLEYPDLKKLFIWNIADAWNPLAFMNNDMGIFTVDYHKKAGANTFKMYNALKEIKLEATISGYGTDTKDLYLIATKNTSTQEIASVLWNNTGSNVDVMLSAINLPYSSAGKNIRIDRYLIDICNGNYYYDFINNRRGYPVGEHEEIALMESAILMSNNSYTACIMLLAKSVLLILISPADDLPTEGPVIRIPPVPPRNLAAGKNVAARSSNESPCSGWSKTALTDGLIHSFKYVNAGNPSMGWISDSGYSGSDYNEWVSVDLGEEYSVDKVVLYPVDHQSDDGFGFPVDFTIQTSGDGSNWLEQMSKKNYNNGNRVFGKQIFSISPVGCRYVRINSTKPGLLNDGKTYEIQMAELEVYSSNNPAEPQLPGAESYFYGSSTYKIDNRDTGQTLHNMENTGTWTYTWNNWDDQKWTITGQESGYYKITSVRTGKVVHGSHDELWNVIMYDWYGWDDQLWKIENSGETSYKITCKGTGMVLTSICPGCQCRTMAWNGNDNQKWTFYNLKLARAPAAIKKGDANSDDIISIVDALLVARYYVGLSVLINLDAADTDCNNSVDILDALLISKYYVGLISGFC